MSVHPNGRGGPLRRVRYPVTLVAALLVLVSVAVYWAIYSHWLVLASGPVFVVGAAAYRKWFRSPAKAMAERERQYQLRGGWATPLDLAQRMGYFKLRRQMRIIRPSLAERPWWQKVWIPAAELGARLVHSTGWLGRQILCVSAERSVGIFGPAGSGKTGQLGTMLIEAVGAALVTSMKPDLVTETIELRRTWSKPAVWWRRWLGRLWRWLLRRPAPAAPERPVWIFNPNAIGGPDLASTVTWNPLIGCEDVEVAQERAGYLMSGAKSATGIANKDFWKSQGVRILTAYLHAAALGNQPVMDVYRWVGKARHDEHMQAELRDLIAKSPSAESMGADLEQWFATNDNTASSTETTITESVQWLSTRAAAAAVTDGKSGFDIDAWLEGRGTLYLLAEDREHGSVSPLFCAFVGWLLKEVTDRAARSAKGRLDPHLTMILDEVANVCPIPLAKLIPTIRGFNIGAHLGWQSPAQIAEKYGEYGAQIITDNLYAELYTGGYSDPELLKRLSDLFGKVYVRLYSEELKRSEYREVPVVRPERIRDLDEGEVLMVVNGVRGASVGRLRPFWKMRAYKRVCAWRKKQAKRAKKLAALEAAERKAITREPAAVVPEPRQAEGDGVDDSEPTTAEREDTFDLGAVMRNQWQSDPKAGQGDERE